MPQASGAYQAPVKYAYLDHDTAVVSEAPPILNQWYEVFHESDVRLLWCTFSQTNTETAAKTIEIKWTIDGNVYFKDKSAVNSTLYYVFRTDYPSTGGTFGLMSDTGQDNAGRYVDKRGQDFKVEVRITSALGTAQTLTCYCVYETLEVT